MSPSRLPGRDPVDIGVRALSVHGEYSRALENVVVCVRALDRPERSDWLDALEGARLSAHPDLSSAARAALSTVSVLHQTPAGERLTDVVSHLEAHCRAILGLPAGG